MRCGIYTRVSTDEQAKSAYSSLERQREVCQSYIEIHREDGWRTVAVYEDPGYSGKDLNRPGIQELLEDVRQGKLDIVVAYKLDRVTRSLKDFYQLWEVFESHRVSFATASEQFDTSTSTGKLMLNMLLSFAQFERELTRERTMSKMAGRAERGLWNGGWVPLGYDYDKARQLLAPNPHEAEVVQFIYRRIIETGSPCAVANEANRLGYRTKQRTIVRADAEARVIGGKRLDEDTVIRIVRNPIYRGYLRYNEGLFKGGHEPIIDEGTWAQANAAIGRGSVGEGMRFKDDHVHLLKGLLVCGHCGNHMTPYPSGKKDRDGRPYLYYACTSVTRDGRESPCAVRSLPARTFEDLVTKAVADLGNSPAILEECVRQANGDATRAVADLEARRQSFMARLGEVNKGIRRIVEYIKTHDGVPAEIDAEMQELDRERQELHRAIEKADLEIALRKKKVLDADLMRQQLQHFEHLVKVLPPEDQKELFQLLIKEVRVHPFDPRDVADGEAVVARVRGRLYRVQISLHQLPGADSLRSPDGASSDFRQLGSAGRIRTYDQSVNSRPLYP